MVDHLELIVCTFDATDKAEAVKDALEALDRRLTEIKLGNIAVVAKTADGEIRFHETEDHRNVISGITAGIAGGAAWFIYAFAGSMGSVAGPAAYEAAYNTAERLVHDSGFSDASLVQIGERLAAGSSALITLVRMEERQIVTEELARLGGTIDSHLLPADVASELLRSAEEE